MAPINVALQPLRLLSGPVRSTGYPRRASVLRVQAAGTRQAPVAFVVTEPHKPAEPGSVLPDSGSATRPSEIAELLYAKEELLKEILEPGQGMPPKASVVLALRKEIASLRQQLRQEIAGGAAPAERPAASTSSPTPNVVIPSPGITAAAPANGNRAARVKYSPSSTIPQGSASRVRKALRMVEERLATESSGDSMTWSDDSVSIAGMNYWTPGTADMDAVLEGKRRSAEAAVDSGLSVVEQMALEVLYIENTKLRNRMEELKLREAKLKDLVLRQQKIKAEKERAEKEQAEKEQTEEEAEEQ